MIYCFKKLRELKLTHIFFLHYAISLIVGGAAIAGLFVLGGGLQFYSVVVLCMMYTQPTFIILRRIKMYEVRRELKHGEYTLDEKISISIQALGLKPGVDKDFIIYVIVTMLLIVLFFPYNELLIIFNNQLLGIILVLFTSPGIATLLSIVKT